MHKIYGFIIFLCLFFSIIVFEPVNAISTNLVISQIQTRSLSNDLASEELIELYNNSDSDVDISDWLLQYGTSGDLAPTRTIATFKPSLSTTINHLYITKRSSILFVSKLFVENYPKFGYDFSFANGLSDDLRWLSLTDKSGNLVDFVEWGETVLSKTAEGGQAAVMPITTQLIQRKSISPGVLQDTDNNYNDFELAPARTVYGYGALYEKTDQKPDACPNIDGIQDVVPDGYKLDDDLNCMLNLLPLRISEVLPNPLGSDDGGEFVEIYNPNNTAVSLTNYKLGVGTDSVKKYNFPDNTIIEPNQYMAFYNTDIKFTLLNTTDNVQIWSADGNLIDQTTSYSNPEDGESWAIINKTWQYTNQVTPSATNLSSIEDENITPPNLVTCAANQYRNPETGRCKLIVSSNTTLAPCKDGQYRSEETNRCRNIVLDVSSSVPCTEGQERNPATNRCRTISSVLGSSDLAPCKEGQERNPETNRCRNIVNSTVPVADYKPEQTTESSNNYVLWWSLAGVGAVAITYGIWEWRQEIGKMLKKIKKKFYKNNV